MANIIEHLRFRAQTQPDAIAIQLLERSLSYAELFDLVRATAHKLRSRGIRPGDVVVTCFRDVKTHWIVTLALFHEAAISCANDGYSPIHSRIDYRWVATDKRVDHFPPQNTVLIDDSWSSDSLTYAPDIDEREYVTSGATARLILTSGSTGLQKAVALSVAVIEQRALETRLHTDNWRYRTLVLMGFSTIAGFTHAVACLISGTPLFCEESWSHIPLLIEKFSIECLDGAPAQLISLIELESDRRRFRSLKLVKYVGAAMSASQLKRIRDGLCDNVMNLYGSTEVGHVAARSMTATTDATAIPGVVGHLFPNVAVEFVDDFGDPALADTSGRIRIKGRFMASGYHNDPNASSELFKDGWFYPGDIGYMTRDRQLVVTGRESETINRGGDKLSPTEIEDLLADVTGVRECAAFKCRNPRGFEDIAVAFVLAEDFDIRSVHDIIRENVTAHRRPCAYIRVNKIPRNGMGKVMRGKLTEIFSDYILKQSAL